MVHLSEIWVYPIKSLAGIQLNRAKVMSKGLEYDRRWMIVGEEGVFLSQRSSPSLAKLDLSMQEQSMRVSLRTDKENGFNILLDPVLEERIPVTIWDDRVMGWAVDSKADEWLSSFLQQKVRLVYMSEKDERQIDRRYSREEEHVSFADGFPYLLISEASLEALNARLLEPAEMLRFRPNFVVSGTAAFEEDTWKSIQIGSIPFRVVKPCARCTLTTVNPWSGVKGPEPLKTLSTFRSKDNKVLFGQNLIADSQGEINLGDQVNVESIKENLFV